MKIQDALIKNKEFWIEERTRLERQMLSHQNEVQRLAKLYNEAGEQIELYDKAAKLLKTLDPVQVDKVSVKR